nr:MAG TPA: hypothetical protein [Caudoviricetes sp.]
MRCCYGFHLYLPPLKKRRRQSVTPRIQLGSDVIVYAEMDVQWATSGLNHVSAGCFTPMTGYAGESYPRLWLVPTGNTSASS